MAKRQRFVYPSNEIAHLWANKTQETARNPQGNFYFKNGVLYSYRDSYPIASHVTGKRKGESAVLIRSDTYSVTTSGHISAARGAVRSGVKVFTVPSVETNWQWSQPGADHVTNLAYFVSEAKQALKKAEHGRKYGSMHLAEAFGHKQTAAEYAAFFGLPSPLTPFSFLPKGKAVAALRAKLAEREARAAQLNLEARAKQEARYAEQRRIDALDLSERIALWRAGDRNARINSWDSNVPTMLRISGADVETSKGARVPLAHAVRAMRFVRACVSAGRDYQRNGHTEHVGHYVMESVNLASQVVTIGCHVIPFTEVEAIAPALEQWAVNRLSEIEALHNPTTVQA
jgi:hypothetical protein